MKSYNLELFFIALLLFVTITIFSCEKKGTDPEPEPQPEVGILALEVLGLQSYLKADITINGSDNYSRHCTTSVNIPGLAVGDYSILAYDIVDSLGDTIGVNPDSQMVSVQATKTTSAQVFYQSLSFGSLQINPTGLPAGESYDIVVTSLDNPSLTWVITQAMTLDSLKPGPYRIVADEIVITGGQVYKPNVLSLIHNVVAGAISELAIIYKPKYGSLSMLIIGLPTGTIADVTVTGFGGEFYDLEESKVLDSVEAGVYIVNVYEVTADDGTDYTATPDSQQVTVVGGEISFITVDYQPKYGVLFLEIPGLPEGVQPDVIITGPSLTNEAGIADGWYDSLDPGDYSVVADTVESDGGTEYIPEPDSQVVVVGRGDTAMVSVVYEENLGALSALIIGLPSGTQAAVTVTGPNNYTNDLVETDLIDSLKPGVYKIIAEEVETADGTPYVAKPDSQMVTVVRGDTTLFTVDYEPKYGTMVIEIIGLPAETPAIVYLTRPIIPDRAIEYSEDIDSLEPGDYTVVAYDVTADDGTVYQSTADSQFVRITGGDSSFVFVIYEEKHGWLSVKVTGLPAGVDADVVIRDQGEDNTWNIASSEVIDSVAKGVYTVLAREVIIPGGDTLKAKPDSLNVTVTAGDTAKVEIKYDGLSFKVFTSLHDGSLYGSVNISTDGASDNLYESTYDENLVQPFVADGCMLTAVDVTDIGIEQSVGGSLGAGSFEKSQSLVISKQNRSFEFTDRQSYNSDVPPSIYGGYTYAQGQSGRGPILQIDNPRFDTIVVTIHWDITGSASYTGNDYSRAGGTVRAYMRLYDATCYPTLYTLSRQPVFNAHTNHNHTDDTVPLSGDTTIIITQATYLIWFALQSSGRTDSFQEDRNASHDGEGSGRSEMTTVISVAIEKY